jgi:hypothetical protein
MGFPKMGSTTLFDFFLCAGSNEKRLSNTDNTIITATTPTMCTGTNGNSYGSNGPYRVTHSQRGSEMIDYVLNKHKPPLSVYKEYYEKGNGIVSHRDPIDDPLGNHELHVKYDWYDPSKAVHTQLDHNNMVGSYPQIQLLDEMHTEQPNSIFVLPFRPIQDWIRSVQHWGKTKGNFMSRIARFDIPGLEVTNEQRIRRNETMKLSKQIIHDDIHLVRWWCGHVLHMREYVQQSQNYPSHKLIEIDLYDSKTTSQVLGDIFNVRQNCWGHCNKGNKK